MNRNININLLLCEKADKQVRNVNNIFDSVIFTDGDDEVSYEILTIINQLEVEQREFELLYFIEGCDDKKDRPILYLGRFIYKTEKERSNIHPHSISRFIVDHCSFPKGGEYEVKVFMKQKGMINKDEESTKNMLKYANEDDLVATCPFKVEFK